MFPPTRWSLVVTAARPEALEELCLIYWQPVYHFLRSSGRSAEDAEDLTQSFFADLLKGDAFARARQECGKLRSFLLGALKRHLEQDRRFRMREKRAADRPHLPLATSEMDFEDAEHHYVAQPVDELTPEMLFERRWVLELLTRAHRRLQRDYESAGKGREYRLLKGAVMTTGDLDGAEAARALGVKEASVRVLVHRMRRNFRAAFKEEIAETVSSRDEVESEYHRLLCVFS
jgi:RNA polymerase sigma-70 factor (ECF subfamily)